MSRRRHLRWVGLVFVVALLAASCGDDDDDSADTTDGADTTETTEGTDTTADASDTTVAAPTGDPITIMVMYEASGSVATPEVPEGADAAAQAINDLGGIAGRPVELIECDLANDPNAARECANQAVSEEVVAVIGPVSANAGEYMPVLEQAQIPVVGNVPASAADFTSPASFPLYGGIVTASAGLADALYSEAGATVISAARIDLAAAAAIAAFANQGLARYGVTLANDVAIPTGAPDMATYVASTLEGGTDGVLVGLAGQDATNFIIQLRQTAPEIPISATTTEFEAVVDALGDLSDGIYVTTFFATETTDPEAYASYVEAMEAAGYDTFGGFRTNSYSAVQVVAEVASTLPEVTGPALYAALPQQDDINVDLLPPLQFVEGGVGGVPRVFNPCGLYQQLEGGEFTTITPAFINMFTGEAC